MVAQGQIPKWRVAEPRRSFIPAWSHSTQGLSRRSALLDYGAALGTVGVALAIRWMLRDILGDHMVFLLATAALLPLVVLVRPGAFLAAAALGLFGSWYLFVAPGGRFELTTQGELVGMGIYGIAIAAALLAASLARRLTRRVQREGERAERRLHLLELVTDAAPALISYLDRDRRYRFVNQYYEAWFGKGREEIVGRLAPELLGESLDAFITPYIERTLNGEYVRFEMQVPHRSGQLRWVDAQYVPDRDVDGKVVGMFVLGLDISERKQAEEALREETRVAETLNRVGRALGGELDPERIAQLVADEATAVTGAEFGAFVYDLIDERGERMLYALSGVPPEAAEGFPLPEGTTLFEQTFPQETVVCCEDATRDRNPDAGPSYARQLARHLSATSYLAVPVVSRDGRPLGSLFFGHSQPARFGDRAERVVAGIARQASVALDNAHLFARAEEEIRQRKEVEIALRQREAELREADTRKDEFLATLAHELRNPLAPIGMAAGILRQVRREPERVDEVTRTIERQVTQLVRLIDDLLDVSRISRGKISLRRTPLTLQEVLTQALDGARPLFDRRGIRLHVSTPSEPVVLDADATRLFQVMGNLLSNAGKYTDAGGDVYVSLERCPEEAVLVVRDSGIGIAPEKLPSLFQMFSQVEASLDRAQGGLGIGLALSRSLVELHGGTIEARSEGLGRGSEFIVRLPVATSDGPVQPEAAAPPSAPPSGRRVLVVDDNEDVRVTTASLLELQGHEVASAADGEQALEVAHSWRPEVVLLDIGLPRIDGYEVARRMRRESWGEELFLVAMTGWGQDKDRQLAYEAGFDAHVTKPADPVRLDELLGTTGVGS